MSRDEIEDIKKGMEAELAELRVRDRQVDLDEMIFLSTNTVDHPRSHLPRAGELAMGVPFGPVSK
jgi:hypothetical protein